MIARILVCAILLSGAAAAQRRNSRNGDPNTPSIPTRVNRLDMLGQMLNLTKDQKKDVKTIMDDGQKEASPLHEQLAQCRAQVAAAIAAGKSQEEIGQAIKAYADVQAQMTAVEMKAFAGIYKDLDSAQQQNGSRLFAMMNGVFKGKNWMDVE
jgi:Tfp pilus assembly protein FimV